MIKTIISYLFFTSLAFCLLQCGMKEKMEEVGEIANKQFGDQNFKNAIALIELHKIRFGHYPETLDSLKYLSDFDLSIKTFVTYQKVDSGYSLNLARGFSGKAAKLNYPATFWQGLGLRKSNLKNDSTSAPL